MFNIENCFDKKTNKPLNNNALGDDFDEFINKLDVEKTTKKVNARSYYLLKCKLERVLMKNFNSCILGSIENIENGVCPETTVKHVKDSALFFVRTKYRALRKYDSTFKKMIEIEQKYKIKGADEINIKGI